MTKELEVLLKIAKKTQMTESQREEQRQSFAFGNSNIENARISKKTVRVEAARLRVSHA